MQYLSNKNGFLGIDNKFNFKEKVIIVPFGLEKTVSYGGGTKNGPKEIIKASHQVELYDEELNCEPYKKIGIKTLKPFKIDKNINKALKKISNVNKEILDRKLFPMTFGGEHSITPGCIKPFVKRYKNLVTSSSEVFLQYCQKFCTLHLSFESQIAPSTVLPIFFPSDVVISGEVKPKTCSVFSIFFIKSIPATIFPH